MSSIRWNWLSEAALPIALAILRTCWLWPWLELARRWLSPTFQTALLSVPLIIGLSLGGVAVTRCATVLIRSLVGARLAVAGSGLLAAALVLWWQFYRQRYDLWDVHWVSALSLQLTHWDVVVPPPFLALLAVIYLWTRGVTDGSSRLEHEDVWGAFARGFVALTLFTLVTVVSPVGLPKWAYGVVVLFFTAGMIALALSSLKVAQRGKASLPTSIRANRYWLVSALSVIGTLLGLGWAVAALLAPEDVARVLEWLGGALALIARLIYVLLFSLSSLLFLILYPLAAALASLAQQLWALFGLLIPLRLPRMTEAEQALEAWFRGAIALPESARWLGLISIIALIVLILALGLRGRWFEAEEAVEETRELILSVGLLHSQVAALWRRWLHWLRRFASVRMHKFLPLEGEPPTRRMIRAVYQALLAVAGKHGYPRRREQTPLEYQQALEQMLPQAREALRALTDGYVQARYDATLPTSDQVDHVQQAWDQIQACWTGGGAPTDRLLNHT
ncbi:MAG: DUF4129 domain-containing protein [Anaerolineae bacterium]|nr:DUF4129 domain-containing protein [Anaerolineae bacterium]MDW8099933.1 DUF4129 domain-containing protein [Anaerolineae bacterium]